MAKLSEMPISFERKVLRVESQPGDSGYVVEFRCGHKVWFAAPPKAGEMHHCSICFAQWYDGMKDLRARRAGA